MKRIGLIILVILTTTIVAMSQNKAKASKQEERLIEQVHFLSQLNNNASRRITEYDQSNDSGTEIALWSNEKTIAEAKELITKILSDRKALKEEKSSYTLAYQSRVRRWGFDLNEKDSHYDNILRILTRFNQQFDNSFEELILKELDTALNLKYYPSALYLLDNYAQLKEREERLQLFRSYLPRFKGTPEEVHIEVRILENDQCYRLQQLEEKISFDKSDSKIENEWKELATELSQKVEPLIKKTNNAPLKSRLKNMLDNRRVTIEVSELNAQTGDLTLKLLACIRSEKGTLYRTAYDSEYKQTDKKELTKYSGISIIRTEVKDKLPKVGRYKYSLKNPTLNRENESTTFAYNQLGLSIQSNDENSMCLIAVNPHSGKPVAGVAIEKRDIVQDRIEKTLYTDKRGMAILPHSKSSRGYNVVVRDSRLAQPEYFYIHGSPEQITKNERVLNYYPDRPIYRRGQEVKVGLLLTDSKGKELSEVPNQRINLRFIAYKGSKEEEIERVTTTTNRHGVAEVKFDIPEDSDLSNFQIESEYGRQYVSVEDYKLQYLDVQFKRIPKGHVFDQPLVIEGETHDLNGRPTAATIILTYDRNQRIEVKSGIDGKFIVTTPPVSKEGGGNRYYYWGYEPLQLSTTDALGNVATTQYRIEKLNTDMPLEASILTGGEKNINKEKFTLNTTNQPYTQRLLGDLSNRSVRAELINRDSTEKLDLGALPIQGKKEFSLPKLKSGVYKIKLYTIDGYGKEISSTSDELYFYSESDRKLYSDDLLWSVKTSQGGILYGSSKSMTITMIKYINQKAVEYLYIPIEKGVLYQMSGKELKGIDQVLIRATSSLKVQEERVTLIDKENSEEHGIKLSGLDFGEAESLLPGSRFKRTLKLTQNGKALKDAPVMVTVFDKGVADAAGTNDFWHKVGRNFYSLRSMEPTLYRMESTMLGASEQSLQKSADVAMASPEMANEDASGLSEISLRSNFTETAFFSALLTTDNNGEVVLEFDLPDTETKYNIKVYSYAKGFEHQLLSDYNFKVFSPLSIDLSVPRFLTWDDQLQGEVLIRNSSNQAMQSYYQVTLAIGEVLTDGKTLVPAGGTKAIPFSLQSNQKMGEEVALQAKVLSGEVSDGIERRLPLISNLSTYIVATPISLYKQDKVTLLPPKVELGSSDLLLELYLDPIMVILTRLAYDYREVGIESKYLFSTLYQYNIYKRLELYLTKHPDFKALLKTRAAQLSKLPIKEKLGIEDRLSDPQTLSKFFSFITNDQELSQALQNMEEFILSHRVSEGGFRYSDFWVEASPFLTSYILNKMAPVWRDIENKELRQHLLSSIPFLLQELDRKDSYYKDYISYALIAHSYGVSLDNLSPSAENEYRKQVQKERENYQKTYTSQMLRFAEHSRIYDTQQQKTEVRKFIEDRCAYSWSDDELASMKIYLNKDQDIVDEQLIEFLLKMKQATLWHSSGVMDISEMILDKIAPSEISDRAEVIINGQGYTLNSEEKARGYILVRYPDLTEELTITWKGIKSDYVFGGIRYFVTEPSKTATPTGDKLKVRKQIFVRQVSADGKQEFQSVTPEHPAQKGDKLIIRYTIDSQQDLSLVTLVDPRPAGAEFGYDFEGYRFGDRLWWSYSRRDQEDRIYIDYLPRGQHTIELEATASNSGTFTYGPAQIQSYYAPEFAGNSAGGSMQIEHKD